MTCDCTPGDEGIQPITRFCIGIDDLVAQTVVDSEA